MRSIHLFHFFKLLCLPILIKYNLSPLKGFELKRFLSMVQVVIDKILIVGSLRQQMYLEKKGNSNKILHHRRVITEVDTMPTTLPQKDTKKAERVISKPRFLDVYSKYLTKNGGETKKYVKMPDQRPLPSEKRLKTEANEEVNKKYVAPSSQTHRTKVPTTKYEIEGVAGKGTFGVVYFGTNRLTGEKIAVKKVFQDKKYKNRQHTILKMLSHPNNLSMLDSFLTHEGKDEYLNIVMEYYPDNLYQVVKRKELSPSHIKLYAYQLFRGLNYLNMMSIAHRDIKPQNILVDKISNMAVITDFGSAKQLVKNEANLAYICSRCYRAPELIFGATDYTPQIDMWSMGCVLVEMINGSPPFLGDSQIDQLIEIIKALGTPTKAEVEEMNKNYDMKEYSKFPRVKTTPWKNLLKTRDPLLTDLVSRVMQYSPLKRLSPASALYHEYFDELRDETKHHEMSFKLKVIPNLFSFTEEQSKFIVQQTGRKFELVPPWLSKRNHPSSIPGKPLIPQSVGRRVISSSKAL